MTREWYLRNLRKPFMVFTDAYISNISIGDKITIYKYEIVLEDNDAEDYEIVLEDNDAEDNDVKFEASQIEFTIKSIKEINEYQEKDSYDAHVYDVELSDEDNNVFWSSELEKITKEDKRISYFLNDNEKQRSKFLYLKLPEIIDKIKYRFTTDSYELMGVDEDYKVDIPLPVKFKLIIDEFRDARYDFIQWSGSSLKFSNRYSSNEVSVYMNLYKDGLIPKEDINLRVNIKDSYLKYKEIELFQKLLDYHATEECQEVLRKVSKDYHLKCFRKTQDDLNVFNDMKIKQKALIKLETNKNVEDYVLTIEKTGKDAYKILAAEPNDLGSANLIGKEIVPKWNKFIGFIK